MIETTKQLILEWAWLIFPISVLMFVGTLLIIPMFLIRLPEDYFVSRPVLDWESRNPLVHWGLIIAKNVLGLFFVGMGIVMLVLPGQGLLTILLGIIMMDFPGKRALERRLIQIQPLRHSANWLRTQHGRPPFLLKPANEK